MQIISGLYKGYKLKTMGVIKPTMGRVKEAIFNLLIHNQQYSQSLREGVVLDLFCGSGALGLEAISNGAKHAIMVDINTDDVTHNSKVFLDNVTIIESDIMNIPHGRQKCDLVFIDPPYDFDSYEIVLKNLIIREWIKPDAIVIVETEKKNIIKNKNYQLLDVREYGKAKILILRLNMPFDINKIRSLLLSKFNDADISLEDTVGDGDHFSLVITSSDFYDKSIVDQHKMVYQALGDKVGNDIHALQLKTIIKDGDDE